MAYFADYLKRLVGFVQNGFVAGCAHRSRSGVEIELLQSAGRPLADSARALIRSP